MLKARDNYQLSFKEFVNEKGPLVIIASATGVKKEFYSSFAKELSKYATVITFDYRGIGGSLDTKDPEASLRKLDKVSIKTWAKDTEDVVLYFQAKYPNRETVYIGHSVGGHVIGMMNCKLDRVILASCNSAYYQYIRIPGSSFFYPMTLAANAYYGYFKSSLLNLGESLPRNVGLQWAYWGRFAEYMRHNPETAKLCDKVKIPMIAVYFSDDELSVPEGFKWGAFKMFPNSNCKLYEIPGKGGHFGFFRGTSNLQGVLDWILKGETRNIPFKPINKDSKL